ncbi:MAG TPA: hypothetical protein VMT16_14110 [Thermoanaerobaculia bacterium]|nr:hypothetical protein [Thermoanaerobaculia bacterium]
MKAYRYSILVAALGLFALTATAGAQGPGFEGVIVAAGPDFIVVDSEIDSGRRLFVTDGDLQLPPELPLFSRVSVLYEVGEDNHLHARSVWLVGPEQGLTPPDEDAIQVKTAAVTSSSPNGRAGAYLFAIAFLMAPLTGAGLLGVVR